MEQKYSIRSVTPNRTCEKVYKNYRSYKKYLASDFNNRCGYCDDYDGWQGGEATYHVDHFAPKKKFENLENDYNNLVYSCSYCNRFKSDDWPSDNPKINIVGNQGYIDPCEEDYQKHFYRDSTGNIKFKTAIGEYVYNKLQLYLMRHGVLWNLTRLQMLKNQLLEVIEGQAVNKDQFDELYIKYAELSIEFDKYFRYILGDIEIKN